MQPAHLLRSQHDPRAECNGGVRPVHPLPQQLTEDIGPCSFPISSARNVTRGQKAAEEFGRCTPSNNS